MTVAWLALVTLAFHPVPIGLAENARSWGLHAGAALPAICLLIVLLLLAWDAAHRRFRWYLVAWFVIAVYAFAQWPPWAVGSLRTLLPIWFWQLVLVPTGVALAVGPLVTSVRNGIRPEWPLATESRARPREGSETPPPRRTPA